MEYEIGYRPKDNYQKEQLSELSNTEIIEFIIDAENSVHNVSAVVGVALSILHKRGMNIGDFDE